MRSVELFSGAGGLALGIHRAGFSHIAIVERERNACATLIENARRRVEGIQNWPIHGTDVEAFNFEAIPTDIELLAAGVPCQPFSIGGKHKGHRDERNMFPALVRAIQTIRPKAVLVENVKGLTRPSFARYFGYIQLLLSYPEISRRIDEVWHEHSARLERYHTKGRRNGLWYRVIHRVLNAADYGVPQKRERLFIVAIRADLGIEWSFPSPTHSLEALLHSQRSTGEYWERHQINATSRLVAQKRGLMKAETLAQSSFARTLKPWRTVRDAVADLPKPAPKRLPEEPALTHFLIPGARSYVGHTGSVPDEPAKTLKAGVHGVPGGENTVAEPGGGIRYFTVRESARLQTFPDTFVFPGSWTESMRQIGNAVPVIVAEQISRHLGNALLKTTGQSNGRLPLQSSRQA